MPQWNEERQLYVRQVERLRFWLIVAAMLCAGLALALLVCLQDPPSCGVRLYGDGSWQRVDGQSNLLDDCKLVTWEE